MLDGYALVLLDDELALLGNDVETRRFAAQAVRLEFELDALLREMERVHHEEPGKDLFRGIADRLQQDGRRHLAPTIDAEIQIVLGVELEIQPGATVRNDARGEQQIAGRVRLAACMFEKQAW